MSDVYKVPTFSETRENVEIAAQFLDTISEVVPVERREEYAEACNKLHDAAEHMRRMLFVESSQGAYGAFEATSEDV